VKIYIGLILMTTCFLPLTNVAQGATWYVHPDSTLNTIQAGVDLSSNGDTVLVAAGTYTGDGNRDIDFGGKAIAVVSESGLDATVIDCEGTASNPHRGFYFHSEEGSNSIVQGFTITNGHTGVGNGGGIDCTLQSSPTIADCFFLGNHADALGGGIACRGLSNPAILRCTFKDNTAVGYYEGAQGGGVSCFVLSNAIITDCVFISNESQYGGALDCSGSSPVVTNCLFVENTAYLIGGAVFCSSGDPQITNCTFAQNCALAGGALVLAGAYLPSYPVLTNCIMWNDTPNEVEVGIGEPTITYCDVQTGWAGSGNINHDPLFVSGPQGEHYLSQIAAGQAQQSPCVDSGNPAYPIPNGTTRTDEVPDAAPVDMGYHYPSPTGILNYDNNTPQEGNIFLQIYPNPFTYATNIRYSISETRSLKPAATLKIHDASGRIVRSFNLKSGIMNHGSVITWHGDDDAGRELPGGVYFLTLTAGEHGVTEKLLLVR
jgi:hypothetical protein